MKSILAFDASSREEIVNAAIYTGLHCRVKAWSVVQIKEENISLSV